MRFRTDLLVEGILSDDGRLLCRGATRWRSLPLPVRWAPGGKYEPTVVVGQIVSLIRWTILVPSARVVIVAEGEINGNPRIDKMRAQAADGTLRLGADLHVIATDDVGPEGVLAFRQVELLAATCSETPAPCWPGLRFEVIG